ncbi:MAG: proton-conducting transporter membrane subunit [Bacteroidales bacterium]
MMIPLPILIPLLIVVLLIFFSRSIQTVKIIGLSGIFFVFLVSVLLFLEVKTQGIQVTQSGGWRAPLGITLVVDLLSAIMLLVSSFTALLVGIYSFASVSRKHHEYKFFLFFHTLLMGVNGTLITGDIFNMYVWFELMLISSFVLITLGTKRQQLEGAIKYVTMNLLASFLFLAGIGLVYGKTGTLNLADLAEVVRFDGQSGIMNFSFVLFFTAFAIKAAVFPFFFWLPASYHTPPIAVTALFAGLITNVGIYVMIRFFTLYLDNLTPFWQTLLLVLAGLTMVIGVLTAASSYDIRRILSFYIISQMGYLIMGLGFFTSFALASVLFYMVHSNLTKSAAFLAGGLIKQKTGSYDLKAIGGLFKENPFLGVIFFLPALSLAGIPPLSGFFGKLLLIKAGFENGNFLVTGIAVWASVFTLFSMLKIWNEAFWKPSPKGSPDLNSMPLNNFMMIPVIILAFSTLILGVFTQQVMDIMFEATEMIKDSNAYIDAVLK